MARIIWGAAIVALACAAAGCANGATTTPAPVSSVSDPGGKVVEIAVMSGRAQPPPVDVSVAVGKPVTIRLLGLGPPQAKVSAPDGSHVPTVDTPIKGKAGIEGTESRFTPTAPGAYQVQQADAPDVVLARLNAS